MSYDSINTPGDDSMSANSENPDKIGGEGVYADFDQTEDEAKAVRDALFMLDLDPATNK